MDFDVSPNMQLEEHIRIACEVIYDKSTHKITPT